MKNISGKLLVVCLLLYSSEAEAQVPLLENGNFSSYSGVQSTSGGCTFFNTGQLPTWIRTHGSPYYDPGFTDHVDPAPHPTMHLGTNPDLGTGDGIAVDYHFVTGRCYKIKVDVHVRLYQSVLFSTFFTVGHTNIGFYAATGLVEGMPPPATCQDNIPSYTYTSVNPYGDLFQKELIGTLEANLHSVTGDGGIGVVNNFNLDDWYFAPLAIGTIPEMTYTPSADNTQLWIVVQPASSSVMHYEIWLSSVVITPCDGAERICEPALVFKNDAVPPARYDYARKIYAGNSYGTNPDIVSIEPSRRPTSFIATESVTLSPNFIAAATMNGFSFTASIDPGNCPNGYWDDGGDGGVGKAGITRNDHANEFQDNPTIQVYPNPTKDQINISYPCKSAGQLEISIKDVSGRVLYTESVTCGQGGNVQHSVDASSLMPGVYFINLTLNDQHTVKKIVKL